MIYQNEQDLLFQSRIQTKDGRFEINDLDFFREHVLNNLVETIVLSDSLPVQEICYKVAQAAALEFGVVPSSIQNLYEARAKEGFTHFTIPAVNLRTLTFDSARALFRAAQKIDAGAFIFEIARSEILYTEQRPKEYASLIALAAVKEGFAGPLFLQGDQRLRNY